MIKILSDSTCDLSKELTERYNIQIIPLYVRLGDKEYKDIIFRILKSRQFDAVFVATLATERTVSVSDLKIAFEDSKDELGIIGLPIKYYSNVQDAVTDIITMRKSGDMVFAAGSLYLVGQIKALV